MITRPSAGYDLMNEPVTAAPLWSFQRNQLPACLACHQPSCIAGWSKPSGYKTPIILFSSKATFFQSFLSGLDEPFAHNLVYSSHNYSLRCFGPGPYPGEIRGENGGMPPANSRLSTVVKGLYLRATTSAAVVGEFGAVYNGPAEEIPTGCTHSMTSWRYSTTPIPIGPFGRIKIPALWAGYLSIRTVNISNNLLMC